MPDRDPAQVPPAAPLPADPFEHMVRPTPAQIRALLAGPPDDRLLYWGWWNETRNFGDWIGPYLYARLTGRMPVHVVANRVALPHRYHVSCGSLLQKLIRPDTAVVWGTGVMDDATPFARPAEVHAVRGPVTQAALDRQGHQVPDVLGDPGLCLPLVLDPGPRKITHRLGLVSHIVDRAFWDKNAEYLPGAIKLIHLDRPVPQVVADIVSCEAILSSSLHGIIVAHAYGVPAAQAVPCSARLLGDGVKFRDYYESVGMRWQPRDAVRIAFPVWPGGYITRATLPDADLRAMARRLLSVCPFEGGASQVAAQLSGQAPAG